MSDSVIYNTVFQPVVTAFSKKLMESLAEKIDDVNALVDEDKICYLFQQCMLGDNTKPIVVSSKPVEAKKTKASTRPPCAFPECPVHVAKLDRNIEGKFYCSKHFAKMSKVSKASTVVNSESSSSEEKSLPKVETSTFDFATEEPKDFNDLNDNFWKLTPYGEPQQKLVIHKPTGLLFSTDTAKIAKRQRFAGAMTSEGLVKPEDLDPAVIQWLKNCNVQI